MRPGWALQGFEVAEAPPGPDDAVGEADLARTIDVARRRGCEIVVVDHYGAAPGFFEGLHAAGFRLGVIDDRADRDLRGADWVLNQNIAAPELQYTVRPDAKLLLGPRYALLRPEFGVARASLSRVFARQDSRVLVTLGGGGTARFCADLLRALDEVDRPLEIRCVAADSADELTEAARSSRHAVILTGPIRDMAPHMAWADVSVNAGGSTCWELLCLGVPMVVLALSDDQRRNPGALAAHSVAVAAGSFAEAAAGTESLLADARRRREMSAAGSKLVDGHGASRVAAAATARERVHAAD